MHRLAVLAPLLLWLPLGASGNGSQPPWAPQTLRRHDHGLGLKSFNPAVLGNLKDAQDLEASSEIQRSGWFIADVSVGQPAQRMRCLLDTGSSELWMPSKRCETCDNEHFFRADKSETFMPAVIKTDKGMMPVPVELNYRNAEVVGFLVQDVMGMGSRAFPNQSFIIVEQEDFPATRPWDGVCGLGWKHLDRAAAEPLYLNSGFKYQGWYFSLVPEASRDTSFIVGPLPKAQLQEETLRWALAEPVHKEPGPPKEGATGLSFWIGSANIEYGPSGQSVPTKSRFLVDTGTGFILAPKKQYVGVLRTIFPAELFDRFCGVDREQGNLVICDCSITQVPELQTTALRLNLERQVYELSVEQLFKPVRSRDGQKQLCLLQVQKNHMTSMDPMQVLGALLGGSKKHAGSGAMPPPFALTPAGLVPTGSLPGIAGGGDQVVEEIKLMPDGQQCTTTLVYSEEGKLKDNSTKCMAGPGATSRRMQMMMPGIIPMPDDPLDDVWVLGGVFLEHFAVMLDFDNKRIGFAQPSWKARVGDGRGAGATVVTHFQPPMMPRAPAPSPAVRPVGRTQVHMDGLRQVQTGALGGRAPPPQEGSSFPWGTVTFLFVVAAGAGGLVMFYRKTTTRKNFGDEMAQEDGLAAGALEEDPDQGDTNAAE